MEQSREELENNVRKASNRKILRRQMELLAKYSHAMVEPSKVPKASYTMVIVHEELLKAECIFFIRVFIAFLGLLYLIRGKIKGRVPASKSAGGKGGEF